MTIENCSYILLRNVTERCAVWNIVAPMY